MLTDIISGSLRSTGSLVVEGEGIGSAAQGQKAGPRGEYGG